MHTLTVHTLFHFKEINNYDGPGFTKSFHVEYLFPLNILDLLNSFVLYLYLIHGQLSFQNMNSPFKYGSLKHLCET